MNIFTNREWDVGTLNFAVRTLLFLLLFGGSPILPERLLAFSGTPGPASSLRDAPPADAMVSIDEEDCPLFTKLILRRENEPLSVICSDYTTGLELELDHSAATGPLRVLYAQAPEISPADLYDENRHEELGLSLLTDITPPADVSTTILSVPAELLAGGNSYIFYVILGPDNSLLLTLPDCRPWHSATLKVEGLTPEAEMAEGTVCSEDSPLTPGTDNALDLRSLIIDGPVNGYWEAIDPVGEAFDGQHTFLGSPALEGGVYRFRYTIPGMLDGSGGGCADRTYEVPVRVDRCFATVGDRVWIDADLNGLQDDPEADPGLKELVLTFAGPDGQFGGGGDDQELVTSVGPDGRYEFPGLISGNYRISTGEWPAGFTLTTADQESGPGGDEQDSDARPFIGFAIDGPTDNRSLDIGLIPLPNLEARLQIVGVDYPASGICGRFNVILEAWIRNTSDLPLGRLGALVDLDAGEALGAALIRPVGPAVWLEQSQGSVLPLLNPGFDGRDNTGLFDGQSGRLLPGEQLGIRFVVEIDPETPGAPAAPAFRLLARGVALNREGVPIPDYLQEGQPLLAEDWSDSGPAFTGGFADADEPTLLGECWRQSRQLAVKDRLNLTLDASCMARVTPQMLLANFAGQCGEQALPRGGYYRLLYNGTEVTEPFPAAHLIGQSLPFQVISIANDCVPVWGTVFFEDKSPPSLECPPNRYFLCTDIDSIYQNPETLNPDSPLFTGVPVVRDNCGQSVPFKWSDELIVFGCPGGKAGDDPDGHYAVVIRTFTARDASGNQATPCRQYFYFDRPEIEAPASLVRLDFCSQEIPLDEQGRPHPSIGGYPFFRNGFGDIILLDEFRCDFSAAYTDQYFPGPCAGAYKVIRKWTVLDWCSSQGSYSFEQLLEVSDFQGPELVCKTITGGEGYLDTLTVSTGPFGCTAAFLLPAPGVSSECSEYSVKTEVFTYKPRTDPFGNPLGGEDFVKVNVFINNGVVSRVPPGVHYFVYTVTDACGNVTVSEPCVFKVIDRVEPVAICGSDLKVSLGGIGIAQLLNTDIDEGSRDNCGPVSLRIRRRVPEDCLDPYLNALYAITFDDLREVAGTFYFGELPVLQRDGSSYYSLWAEDAFFTCCDVGRSTSVELRVTDQSGNRNLCTVNVTIEDKIAPVVTPPRDQVVDCTLTQSGDLADTLLLQRLFGVAEASDNCGAMVRELPPLVDVDNCGTGRIIRKFQATDEFGNVSGISQQTVTLQPVHDYVLQLPADSESESCGIFTADTLDYRINACDILAVNVKDEVFAASGGECFKIFRTYRVINLCEYDDIAPAVIIGRDEDGNGQAGEGPVFVLRRKNRTYLDDNEDETDGYLREVTSVGYWQYTQIIKVYDREPPAVTFEAAESFCSFADPADCSGPATIRFNITEGCSPEALQVKVFLDAGADGVTDRQILPGNGLSGSAGTFTVRDNFPIGSHRLVVQATDGCGNQVSREHPFRIVDCKPPALVCTDGLTVPLMPLDTDNDGQADSAVAVVRAMDFLPSGLPLDCSGPVTVSINRRGETPDPSRQQLSFTCDDPLNETIPVEIHVWDQALNPAALQPDGSTGGPNHDYCESFVIIEDNQSLCFEGMIAGLIITEEDEPVHGAEVLLSGQVSADRVSNSEGWFEFGELEPGYDYTVTPRLDRGYLNGVSTLDLLKVSKHILGIERLESPYKIIAADANRSQSVSTLDIIRLRKMILGLSTRLEGNTSWRFVPANYVFPAPANPWFSEVPEAVSINDLSKAMNTADFIAIKIGDVTGNASVDNLQLAEIRGGGAPLVIQTAEQPLVAGESYRVVFKAGDLAAVTAYQFTLEWDPAVLELEDLLYGVAGEEHFGVFAAEGLITTSWNQYGAGAGNAGPAPLAPSADPELFSLVLKARSSGRLSQALRLSSRLTRAEAYDRQEQAVSVVLSFDQHTPPPVLELYANFPNPWREATTVAFLLPREGEVTLRLSDINGRLLRVLRGDHPAGYNEIVLRRSEMELPESGVLFYQLEAGGRTVAGKMLLVN